MISPEASSTSLQLSVVCLSGSNLSWCSVSVAQSAGGLRCIHTNICAIRGTTVDIRCIHGKLPSANRVSVKPERVVWFTEMQGQQPVDLREDPAYSGRIKYFCDRTTCTLRMAALRESDSAVYRFAYRRSSKKALGVSTGVSLSVTGGNFRCSQTTSYLFDALIIQFMTHRCSVLCRSRCTGAGEKIPPGSR